MSTLKNLTFLFFAIGALALTSCNKDIEGCTNALSDNFNAEATVDNGTCIAAREKFLGSYSVITTCGVDSYEYTIAITTSSTNTEEVVITNLFQYGGTFVAQIVGNMISFEGIYDGEMVDGNGNLVGTTLTMTLNLTYSSGGYSCILAGTKI